MKIAFVIGSLSFSGAEKVLSIISEELQKMGNEIHVILLQKERGSTGSENGLITHGAKASDSNRFKRLFSRWSAIRSTVDDIDPDIVVSFGSVCNVNTIVSMLGKKIPLVVCERNDPNYDPRKHSEKQIRRILYPFADGYVFQTDRIKEYFPVSIQKKAAVIPNPVVDSGKRWSLQSASKKIISIARLDDIQKDQSSMIKAYAKFSINHPDYTLELYGDGPDKDKYLELIQKMGMDGKIILPGKTNDPTNELVESEIFLLTSIFEGMPNALMEAMSVGIPSISTDCGGGGAHDLAEKYGACMLVSCGNVEEIADALSRLADDDELKQELSRRSVRINSCLGREIVSRQWMEYLKTVVKED